MKSSIPVTAIAVLASSVIAAPAGDITQGGSSSFNNSNVDDANIDWANTDYTKLDYAAVNWAKVDYSKVNYNSVDWEKVNYDRKGHGQWESAAKIFTSSYSVKATPDQVVEGTGYEAEFTGGLKGAYGIFKYGIISDANTICYRIEIFGFRGKYESRAKTATHIHKGPKCESGPIRLAFPNPAPVDKHDHEGEYHHEDEYHPDGEYHHEGKHNNKGKRVSVGCLRGPFKTGIIKHHEDTGYKFHVREIEENPKHFYTDVHSSLALPGAIRGQLE